jgi:hypothetical protein
MIPSQRVRRYTAQFCADGERARAFLERRCQLEALTGGGSVPQAMVDGRPIGGFDELAALERNGGLRRLARAESAAARSVDP